ncbi:MAG: DUF2828 family protein [Candidatus Avelusimicrobium sp.]|uniref:DUF2828 family protein n=1 Tax=Candidatus Avelusimicrobium sp. TaxID=3048833 RepID=UPI003EFCB0EE
MKKFFNNLVNMLKEEANVSYTENGALGYRQTGKSLLDMNFRVSSYRRAEEENIMRDFTKAFYEDKLLALKWLFFARDVRGGLGERRLFRVILTYLALYCRPKYAKKAIGLVPVYGRYDDLFCLLENEKIAKRIQTAALVYLKKQFEADCAEMQKGGRVSLLAKWLPSCNASSENTKKLAKRIREYFRLSEKDYRKTLSSLRSYLDVTEVKTCANRWGQIDYSKVPARANLLYGDAFLKHDEAGRRKFLDGVLKHGQKMNASVLYPHDIVGQYRGKAAYDANLEALWKSLSPAGLGKNASSSIVVADGSGSMYMNVGGSAVLAIDVCNALAVYFAERLSGAFKDKFITFSNSPQLVDLSKGKNLFEKLNIVSAYNEVANTNIEAVFDLILQTARKQNTKKDALPETVFILSDMEFDRAASAPANEKLFQTIRRKYEEAGYKLPRLVFWNLCGRSMTVPLRENENGVMLISGFSPNIVKMVLSDKLDPYEALKEVLEAPRYDLVHNAYCRSGRLRAEAVKLQ